MSEYWTLVDYLAHRAWMQECELVCRKSAHVRRAIDSLTDGIKARYGKATPVKSQLVKNLWTLAGRKRDSTRRSFTRGTPRDLFSSIGLMAVHSWPVVRGA